MASLFDMLNSGGGGGNQNGYTNQLNLQGLGSYGTQPAEVAKAGIGAPVMGGAAAAGAGGWADLFKGLFNKESMFGGLSAEGAQTPGWGATAVGAASALASGYLGMQQYGLAKDKFEQSKEEFNKNYEAQRTLTNSQLEDRQRARVASNAGAYESVGTYMKQNGVR